MPSSQETGLSVASIAYSVGFEDNLYFPRHSKEDADESVPVPEESHAINSGKAAYTGNNEKKDCESIALEMDGESADSYLCFFVAGDSAVCGYSAERKYSL